MRVRWHSKAQLYNCMRVRWYIEKYIYIYQVNLKLVCEMTINDLALPSFRILLQYCKERGIKIGYQFNMQN
jgi:hypothetical protein